MREWYRRLPIEERRAIYARRDFDREAARDRDRYAASPERRAATAAAAKRAGEKYPERRRARTAVGNALRDGRLTRGPCELAGNGECRGRVEAHHEDYERPLDVRWLCAKHHGVASRLRDAA